MATFLVTVVLFAVVLSAMAVGVALTGRRLQGSCGGSGGGACGCSPVRRAACKEKPRHSHAETPIDPSALNRNS